MKTCLNLVISALVVVTSSLAVSAPLSFTMKLYDQPRQQAAHDASCDVYYAGKFFVASTGGYHARLQHTISTASTCEIMVPSDRLELVFFLHPTGKDSCGSSHASFGAVHYVDGQMVKDSNGQPVVYSGEYTDNRERLCEDVVAGAVVMSIEMGQGRTLNLYGE